MSFVYKFLCSCILLLILPTGESLRCYQCSSRTSDNCDYPLNRNNVAIQECASDQHWCALLNVSNNGVNQITRECAAEYYCSRGKRQIVVESFAKACSLCSENLCNSVSQPINSVLHVLFSFVVGASGYL